MHISVPVDSTVELLNFTPVNPLVSRCEIKVCYVSDKPNRNKSVITKAVATEMARSLPGCPIVGFYDEETGDFQEHNREIVIEKGKFKVLDTTKPYGFVDKNAKVWFQKFLDDGVEHEYLMTEGYIWTGVYPESKRIVERGNNQSMELFNKLTKGTWTKDAQGKPQFFIISEAIIQKLCILGENVEPCFEGAGIAAQFSFDDEFKQTLYSMIEGLQTALEEGGTTQMNDEMNTPIIEEQDAPVDVEDNFKKKPEEEEEDKKNPPSKGDNDSEDKDTSDESTEDEDEKKKKKMNHAKSDDEDDDSDNDDDDDKCPKCGKKKSECTCGNHSLEEELATLKTDFAALQQELETVKNEKTALEQEIAPLREFKAVADKKQKQDMIDSFYMLSDADKADVVAKIDTYSVDDIEAKLSIICVRNKVNFALDDDKKEEETPSNPMVYTLGDNDDGDSAPAWIKAVRETAKNM